MGESQRKGVPVAHLLISSTILLILGQNFVQSACSLNTLSFYARRMSVTAINTSQLSAYARIKTYYSLTYCASTQSHLTGLN